MKIALIGYGKMGKEVERCAKEKNIVISAVFDRAHPATEIEMLGADVCIDFSIPSAALQNIRICADAKKNIVVGTTGWLDQLKEAKPIVDGSGIGLIHASNFSIGVNVFFKIIEHASGLLNEFSDYDAFVHEIHHNQKLDSPSGTALSIARIIMNKLKRKDSILSGISEGKINANKLHVSSTRSGSVPGTHIVGFDSPADTIELTHTARNRSGFAYGALYAANWIQDKKGIYTMEDVLR